MIKTRGMIPKMRNKVPQGLKYALNSDRKRESALRKLILYDCMFI